ncbi:amidase signature domain-containing protein [Fusarium pseudocircinatum]|uniref:Amidase signature domain-containing protein n=1 Tax=Fusarium pseudocircinatum TaxID=56676 RepID=A0A8H5KN52_9HYPO|nr:amidase signature domain-containing protein [Fusarium pseudocircinatum]
MGSRSLLIVDGVSYLVHPQSLLKITESTGLEPIPVVLLPIDNSPSSVNDALQLINRFADVDDVYSPSFARTAVIRSSSERGLNEVLKKFEASGHFYAVYHVSPGSSQGYLPPGPYFLCDGGIHQAYRLYDDTLDSFIFGVIPDDVLNPGRYTAVTLLSSNGLWKSIPVPSRLYTVRTSTTPLAGARMGTKDIFRLEGTQTTMMSRPWIELYDADEQSADYTKKLIKLGAVIVGKSKMTSFASPEEPTDQWVDLHCPVNPRGDDTRAHRAAQQELQLLWRLRMAGLLYRGRLCWQCVKRTPFSFVEEWEKNPPQEAGGLPLLEYTEKSAFWSLCYDYYHGFDSFRDEYSAKFGKNPFVSSVVRFRWDVGKDVTPQEYEKYMKKLEVFRKWFTENIMGPDSKTLSNTILIMPYGQPHPEYRDEANTPAGTFPTIAEKFISPILHAPQLVLPFAQIPYLSKISGRSEMRPIASTMIGAKGSDLMLIKLAAEAFEKAGWPTSVQTGRYMYPVADNARHVGSVPRESLATYETNQRAVQELQRTFEKKSEDFPCNTM